MPSRVRCGGLGGGEGGKASRKRSRPGPTATVTSGAALSDEDHGQEEGPPPPKKSNMSNSLDADKEQNFVDFFASHPIFYDQTLKEFKDQIRHDYLQGIIGSELGLTSKCTFLLNRSINIFSTLGCIKNIYYLFSSLLKIVCSLYTFRFCSLYMVQVDVNVVWLPEKADKVGPACQTQDCQTAVDPEELPVSIYPPAYPDRHQPAQQGAHPRSPTGSGGGG